MRKFMLAAMRGAERFEYAQFGYCIYAELTVVFTDLIKYTIMAT